MASHDEDLAPADERLQVLRRALARGDSHEQIREAWPSWWERGQGTASEKRWHRDLNAARRAPERRKEQSWQE